MLLGGIMIEIFIVMVALSQVLKYRVNRCVNMIVGPIAIMIVVMTNLSPDLDNIFFMTIEIITLLAIIGVAWRWKIETSQL